MTTFRVVGCPLLARIVPNYPNDKPYDGKRFDTACHGGGHRLAIVPEVGLEPTQP
ncbi:MAG: hypothetical protein VB853_08460 [Pirellulales bacterium]